MYETATLRSGYLLQDSASFAERIERMLKLSVNLDANEQVSSFNVMVLSVCNFKLVVKSTHK